jgi:hypothetical protein
MNGGPMEVRSEGGASLEARLHEAFQTLADGNERN